MPHYSLQKRENSHGHIYYILVWNGEKVIDAWRGDWMTHMAFKHTTANREELHNWYRRGNLTIDNPDPNSYGRCIESIS